MRIALIAGLLASTVMADPRPDPVLLFEQAAKQATSANLEEAVRLLEESLDNGLTDPMSIVADTRFTPIIADPEARPEVRELLQEHARESSAAMVVDSEPGDRMDLRITIVDEGTATVIEGALVELVHADAAGNYSESLEEWNPRIFAYLMTGADGMVSVRTVRPGSYPDDDGNVAPPHVHYSILIEGYRPYYSEIVLGDDSLFDEQARKSAAAEMIPIADRVEGGDVPLHTVTIQMQREVP